MSRRARVAAIVSVGVFVASLDLFIVNIAFPDIQRDFAGTVAGRRSPGSSTRTPSSSPRCWSRPGAGPTALGRKRAFLAGLALFTLASAACAAAPSVERAGRRARACRPRAPRC